MCTDAIRACSIRTGSVGPKIEPLGVRGEEGGRLLVERGQGHRRGALQGKLIRVLVEEHELVGQRGACTMSRRCNASMGAPSGTR